MTTFVIITMFVVLFVAGIFVWAGFLKVGASWAQIEGVSLGRAALLALFVQVINIFVSLILGGLAPADEIQQAAWGMVQFFITAVIVCWFIARFFRARFVQAVKAWLPTLIASVFMLVVAMGLVRPYVAEAFVSPSNAMAPTLLGKYWQGVCAECGNPAYCSPVQARSYGPVGLGDDSAPVEAQLMICGDHFHTTKVEVEDQQERSPDRFLIAKYLTPRRWDIIVFRYPENPAVLYVFRLVGLPGEELYIQDGFVWIDGRKMTPPDELHGLRYVTEFKDHLPPLDLWGTPERPAKLADDEYFVLGDFSEKAKDSRLWRTGAAGHPPFAVPQSHIVGVVTHIYWPPDRIRAFR